MSTHTIEVLQYQVRDDSSMHVQILGIELLQATQDYCNPPMTSTEFTERRVQELKRFEHTHQDMYSHLRRQGNFQTTFHNRFS